MLETVTINGKKADITLEDEKTVGELLSGLDEALSASGLILSGLEIDGKAYGSAEMEKAFAIPLEEVKTVALAASIPAELLFEALVALKNNLESGDGAKWEASAASAYLKEKAADIASLASEAFAGKIGKDAALSVVAERLREIGDPAGELASGRPLVEEAAKRLEDFSLDMQTGKEARAAETAGLFTGVCEKFFRLLFAAGQAGADTSPLQNRLAEFSGAVKEFQSAWEEADTVLAGDVAGYELAPRLAELWQSLADIALPADNKK